MKPIAIYGAGGMGREILLLIQQINRAAATWEILGFFDDGVSAGTIINGFPVLGNLTVLNRWPDSLAIVVAIGKPDVKRAVVEAISNSTLWFPSLTHPLVALSADNFLTFGEGSVLSAGTILTVNVSVGRHVFVNLNCTISHDAVLNDFCALMSGVHVSGGVVLGKGVYVGAGAVLINQTTVGDNAIIGAGAIVTKSVPAHCTAVGVPARPIRFHKQ